MNRVKAVVMDVDGVLTDGTFWWGVNGEEFKRYSFADIMGISMGRKAGLVFALVTGEDNVLIDRLADKLGIVDVWKGCRDKADALRSFCDKYQFELAQVCYIGDDVNDLPALELAGLTAAPADAHETVRRKATLVTKSAGGSGAVRELVDVLLSHLARIED